MAITISVDCVSRTYSYISRAYSCDIPTAKIYYRSINPFLDPSQSESLDSSVHLMST